jgi:hypothetical protein
MTLIDGIPPDLHKDFALYARLEPRCRSNDFARGLEARTADPLWMLARQWQTGEFQGEDAGSPLEVHIKHSTQSLDRVSLGEIGEPSHLPNVPLETTVEQEWLELDWRTRVQIGQQFERFVRSEISDDDPELAQAVIEAYRSYRTNEGKYLFLLVLPQGDEWVVIDRATRRFLQLVAKRVIDGKELLQMIEFNDRNQHKIPLLGGITQEQLNSIVGRLKDWCSKLNLHPDPSKPEAWRSQQLDYRFELNPPEDTQPASLFSVGLEHQDDLKQGVLSEGFRKELKDHGIAFSHDVTITVEVEDSQWQITDGDQSYIVRKEGEALKLYLSDKTRILAPNYRNGELDWYTFNIAGGLQGIWIGRVPIKTHPTQITVGGLSSRWWAFEDANMDFGKLDVAKPDLAKLILMEFALIYGDDWFSVPLPVQMSNLVKINELKVFNVFGEDLIVDPARKPDRDPLLRWEMFTLSPVPNPDRPGVGNPDLPGVADVLGNPVLFIPPVTGFREESPTLEEVRFLRDEGANMVWGVEHTVRNGLGLPVDGFDAQRERSERQREADIIRLEEELAEIEQQLASGDLSDEEREVLENDAKEKREELARLREGPRQTSSGVPRYRLATTVPENWIPFIPAPYFVPNDPRIRLRRAQMLRNVDDEAPDTIRAMSRLLELADDPLLWLEEATVPRSGLRVQLTAQRVRWVDGKTYVWLGRKVTTGKGEGSSGLRFDAVK